MMTKIFALVGILLASTLNANAAGEAMFSKGHSTWTVAGVTCQTATATDITAAISGFNLSAYRLTNLDSTHAVFIGYTSAVSDTASSANVGEKLPPGSNGVWEIGKNPDLAGSPVKIWCIAASAAGSSGVRLARAIFGYK